MSCGSLPLEVSSGQKSIHVFGKPKSAVSLGRTRRLSYVVCRPKTCPSTQHGDPHFNCVGIHQLHTITTPLLSQLYRRFRPLLATTQRRMDSNPQSQQVRAADPRLRPRGHWVRQVEDIRNSIIERKKERRKKLHLAVSFYFHKRVYLNDSKKCEAFIVNKYLRGSLFDGITLKSSSEYNRT